MKRHSFRKVRWANWRLSTKLLMVYMPLIVLPIILGMYFVASKYDQASRQQMRENTEQLLGIVVERLDLQFDRFDELSLKFFIDTSIHELLGQHHQQYGSYELLMNQQQLDKSVNRLLASQERQYIDTCVLYSADGKQHVIGTKSSIEFDDAFMQRMMDAKGGAVWEVGQYAGNPLLDGKIIMGRSINDLKKFNRVGQVVFVIDPEVFQSIWYETVDNEEITFHVVTSEDKVLLQNGSSSQLLSGRYLEISAASESYELTLIAQVPLHHLDRVIDQTRWFTFVVTLACVLVGLVVTRILAIDMIAPIRKLMKNMIRGIRGSQPQQLDRFSGAREIRELNDTFISVLYEINLLNSEVLKTNQRMQAAEIQALVNQLSPHFLYNTLNSIRWMAMIHQQTNIREMTDSLINLLEYSIRDVRAPVPLKKEIDILQDYVNIQKVRFQNFSITVNIPELYHEVPILKFVLQPLVENAIIHGLESLSGGGEICVEASRTGHDLQISVSDNGVGMNEERMAYVMDALESDQDSNHVGLRNIRERVQMYYGKGYGIHITSRPGYGTKVTITIPLPVGSLKEDAG